MNEVKWEAIRVLEAVANVFNVYPPTIATIKKSITDIETLRDRDAVLEKLWIQFANVPMNTENKCIESEFLDWGRGTHRDEILHWFDERYSKGVVYLLKAYGRVPDGVETPLGPQNNPRR